VPEDKLTKQERLRLESINQAISSMSLVGITEGDRERFPDPLDCVFDRAKRIEDFLRAANLGIN
jgi:hypothetical protein